MTSHGDRLFPFARRRTLNRHGSSNLFALETSLTDLSLSSADTYEVEGEDEDEDSIRTGPLGLGQLNSPTEPLVELIFVHGLGGGSRKSWSKTKSEDHFWPRSWLSRDPEFHNVQIHSFGYKSSKSEVVATISGIPDIAQSLLSAIRDSSAIRHSQNGIILVGHSMGGLVVKKAFIQAHATEAYKDIANRIRSLYFLGTPHQGSDFTKTFQNLFKKVPVIRTTESIADLDPSSRLIESLNKEFPQVSNSIELRSFWETEQSSIMGRHQWVVPKHSACLNYTNEISDGLDADHRGMCKYDRPTNPNYKKVRNALSTTVETLVHDHAVRNQNHDLETLSVLRDYLSVREPPEDDLADRLESCLTDDTCAWFTVDQKYQTWRDSSRRDHEALRDFVLIEAGPGAGKSVLAAQIINNLQALNCECSYYFFDAQDREKSTLGRLLRSIAFQMALLNPVVRQALLELRRQDVAIQANDDKYIWRKLFANCILQLNFDKPQYWVIDGLDECPQSAALLQMLFRTNSIALPRIVMTTRPDGGVHNEIFAYQTRISRLQLSKSDTIASIERYVEARTRTLRLRKEEDRLGLVDVILNTAEGSFLWVKLTLDSMSKATGPKQIMDSIQHIPRGMNDLYANILTALDREIPDEQKATVKAVVDWTVLANPPLTVEELEAAVKLDTDSEIFADKMCELLRSLIVIDHSNRVRPVHQTARAYLLMPDLESPFAVSAAQAHARIASLLIGHLQKRLRNLRSTAQLSLWQQRKAGIDDYALLYFSDHIRRAPHNDHSLFLECERFLTDCGLGWIACITLTKSLGPLVKMSQNIRAWLQARIKSTPPIGELARKTTRIQQWSIDLTRLVAKFGRHLIDCPGAIFLLVSPFVPKESILSIQRPRPRDLSVTGIENDKWDDRLCSMFYQGSTCTAIASGKHNFAVAMKRGQVHLYDNHTLQLVATLQHGAVVKLLKYNQVGTRLMTSGFRKVKMWTLPEGAQLWEIAIREPRLAAEFINNGSTLISISSQHKIIKQDSMTGMTLETNERRPSVFNDDDSSRLFRRELQYAEFSLEAEMLATMQRERPVQLTDIEDKYDVGVVELELSEVGDYASADQPITAMTFCANIDIALLAVVYRDGMLAVFDRDLRLLEKRGDSKAATLLAGSPDGLLLAAANVEGVITLYDFEQLTPLHTLYTTSIENIRSLTFSGDGTRIIDIRDKQANIWVPPALSSRSKDDSDSISESTLAPTVITSQFLGAVEGIIDITTITSLGNAEHFVCGRENGSLALYSIRDGKQQKPIWQDQGKQWLSMLMWVGECRLLAFLSGTSAVTILQLAPDFVLSSAVMRHTFLHPVTDLFVRTIGGHVQVFVATTKTLNLWVSDLDKNNTLGLVEAFCIPYESNGLWVDGTTNELLCVESRTLRRFAWDSLEELKPQNGISFPARVTGEPGENDKSNEKIASFDRGMLLSQGRESVLFLRSISSDHTALISPSAATPLKTPARKRWTINLDPLNAKQDSANTTLQASLLPISHLIEHILGFRNDNKQLIFLDKKLWICSYDFAGAPTNNLRRPPKPSDAARKSTETSTTYTRHLFIPDDWISSTYSNTNSQLLFKLGGPKNDHLLFVKKHEVAVIKNPFAYAERIHIS